MDGYGTVLALDGDTQPPRRHHPHRPAHAGVFSDVMERNLPNGMTAILPN